MKEALIKVHIKDLSYFEKIAKKWSNSLLNFVAKSLFSLK